MLIQPLNSTRYNPFQKKERSSAEVLLEGSKIGINSLVTDISLYA